MRNRLVISTALGASVLFACSDKQGAGDQLKIGYMVGLTGALGELSQSFELAALLAQTEVNAAGGVLGRELYLDVRDTQANSAQVPVIAQQLLDEDGTKIMMSGDASDQAVAALGFTEPNGILLLGAVATTTALVGLDTQDLFFRTVGSTALVGAGAARAIAEDGFGTLVTMVEQQGYARDVAVATEATFAAEGRNCLGRVEFPYMPPPTDYSPYLASATAQAPQAMYLVSFPPGGISVLNTWATSRGFTGQWYLGEAMRAPGTIANVGATALEGMRGVALLANPTGRQKIVDAFLALYGQGVGNPNGTRVAENYDAVYVLALAIERAGSTDPVAVREALREVANPPGTVVGPGEYARALQLVKNGEDVNYEGGSGPVDFDDNGDVLAAIEKWQIQNGQFVTIGTYAP